jgi:hypothetical protein
VRKSGAFVESILTLWIEDSGPEDEEMRSWQEMTTLYIVVRKSN